jgi:hypothetical protein
VATVDKQLAAQIEYQTAPMNPFLQTVRRRVLLSMAESASTTDRASLGRQIAGELDAHPSGLPFFCTGLYQSMPYDVFLTEGALPGIWGDKAGAGLVLWTGQGNRNGAYLNQGSWLTTDWRPMIESADVGGLNAAITRSIVIETSSCGAEAPNSTLLNRLMNEACIGVFANTGTTFFRTSRVADWGSMNHSEDIGYHIASNLVKGCTIGESLSEMRLNGLDKEIGFTSSGAGVLNSGVEAQCLLIVNAFGDPTGRYIVD